MPPIARLSLSLVLASLAAACAGGLPAVVNGAQICVTDVDGSIVVTEHLPPLAGGLVLRRVGDAGP